MLQQPFPHTLMVTRDEESSQVCGDAVLADHFRYTTEGWGDWCHRIWNDCCNEIKRCGLWVFMMASICIMNVGYGPRESCAFFSQMLTHAATQMPLLKPDSNTVIHFWPRILVDRSQSREVSEEIRGHSARVALVNGLGRRPAQVLHGNRVSGKTFFSNVSAMKHWGPLFHELGMVITHICMSKGWVRPTSLCCSRTVTWPSDQPLRASRRATSSEQAILSINQSGMFE